MWNFPILIEVKDELPQLNLMLQRKKGIKYQAPNLLFLNPSRFHREKTHKEPHEDRKENLTILLIQERKLGENEVINLTVKFREITHD
jgi:hypothetical protein